jgi:CubicO group peptidase (beta-lactamase class C family)
MKLDLVLRTLALCFVLALLHSTGSAQAQAPAAEQQTTCAVPPALEDGWPVAAPASVGMDASILCAVTPRLLATQMNVHGVLVARRGKLVFERYFVGSDQPWGNPSSLYDFGPQTKHDLRSISKSITALLVGIAVDRKLIPGVDEPVFDFFPEHADLRTPEKERILVRHLLTMSSGLAWDEARPYSDPQNSEMIMDRSADPVRFVLERPSVAPAGLVWNYNGGGTHLLGHIIAKAAGKPFDAFAREVLFEPLGITDWAWMRYRNGAIAPAAGARLRPRDVAKLGQLFLSGGRWNGRQIVSSEWLAEMLAPRLGPDPYFYGYQFWLGRSLDRGAEVKWAAGLGLGGQRLFIVPEYDLVVMITAGNYGGYGQSAPALEILNRYVFPSVVDRP